MAGGKIRRIVETRRRDRHRQAVEGAAGLVEVVALDHHLLAGRIGDKAAERPFFRDDVAAHELFKNRLRYYRMADVALDVREDETIAEIVERLLLELPKSVLARIGV